LSPPTNVIIKVPFKHSKTIYVFTSGRVIVTVQIHSRKKLLRVGLRAINLPWSADQAFTAVHALGGGAFVKFRPTLGWHLGSRPLPQECPLQGNYLTQKALWQNVCVCTTSLVYVNDFRIYNPCNVNVKPCKSIVCRVKLNTFIWFYVVI